MENRKKLYTTEQVGERLEKSTRFVSKLIREKRLRAKKVGNQWRVSEEDLENYLGMDTEKIENTEQVQKIKDLERQLMLCKKELRLLKTLLSNAVDMINCDLDN